jgi:hypothetical protein
MSRYGQITTVYDFGGADIWDLREGAAYPLSLTGPAERGASLGTLFVFEVDPESGWAAPTDTLAESELPDDVRRALSTPTPADLVQALPLGG